MWCNLRCTRIRRLGSLLLLLVACSGASVGAERDWHSELPQARPIGQGELHWFGLSIYSAVLWSEHQPFDQHYPFALQLIYHRHISSQRVVQTSIEEMQRLSTQPLSADKLHSWEMLMSQAFPDVNEGDELVGVFIPQLGCRFYDRNGLRAEIRDPEFARTFFAIWLDPRSKDNALRAHLLGIPQ